jgi:hypothetical protein
MNAGVTSKEASSLQAASQFGIELHEGTGDTEAGSIGLPGVSATVAENENVEFIRRLGGEQRLANHRTGRFGGEVFVVRTTIDCNLAVAGPKEDTGYRRFPPTCSKMLCECH